MERPLAPVLALLLVTAGLAAIPAATGVQSTAVRQARSVADGSVTATDGTDPFRRPPETRPGSVARMTIDDPDRVGRETVDPSLTAALASRTGALQSYHESTTLEHRFDGLSPSGRSSLVNSELVAVEQAVRALYRRQRRAIGAYANGTISETELLRRLAALDRRASHTLRRIGLLYDFTDRLGITYLDARLQRVEGLAKALQGPIRDIVAERLAAGRALTGIHVEAARGALVLATIGNGTYVRETVFLDNFRFTGDRAVTSAIGALAQVRKFYPWATNHRTSNYNIGTPGPFYRVRFTHQQGRLDVSIGARTGQVFREVQNLRLSALPVSPAETTTANGLRVVLNRTYRGGPMRVEVYDASTGERLDATVTLGNRTLGSTGTDGAIWVVEPRAAYGVTVAAGGTPVTLNVSSSY